MDFARLASLRLEKKTEETAEIPVARVTKPLPGITQTAQKTQQLLM